MCQPGRPGPIGCLPERLARLRRLPQREVARVVFLVLVDVDARAVFHAGKIFLRELAVGGKLRDAEVVRAVLGAVGEALLLELRDELRHLRNVVGGAHQSSGCWMFSDGSVFEKGLLVLRGVLLARRRHRAPRCG